MERKKKLTTRYVNDQSPCHTPYQHSGANLLIRGLLLFWCKEDDIFYDGLLLIATSWRLFSP